MKEVLGALGVSIFQLATVFRNEEESATHLPEFTLLEWYRVHADYRVAMDETEALVRAVARAIAPTWPWIGGGEQACSLAHPFERLSVRDAFRRHAGIDPWAAADGASFAALARDIGVEASDAWSWEDVFHLVLLDRIEPHLGVGRATLLCDYPPRLASLARVRPGDAEAGAVAVAERFELYVCGRELCNGFTELTDPAEQRRRFELERATRRRLDLPVHEIDEGLLEALAHCPPCTGNALGVDRLLMLLLDLDSLREIRIAEGPG